MRKSVAEFITAATELVISNGRLRGLWRSHRKYALFSRGACADRCVENWNAKR